MRPALGCTGRPTPGPLADSLSVGEVELVEMVAVPAGERVIDRRGQLVEGVAARCGEDPSRSGPQVIAVALDEVHADRQPGAAHGVILSDRCGFQRRGSVVGELLGALQRTADPLDFQFTGGELSGWFPYLTGLFERTGVRVQHPPEDRCRALLGLGVPAAQADQPARAVFTGGQRTQVRAHVPHRAVRRPPSLRA